MGSNEHRVMGIMVLFVEHALAVDRLVALGRASDTTLERARGESQRMRDQLMNLAEVLDGNFDGATLTPELRAALPSEFPAPDPDGARWIRACLTPDGIDAMKRYHEATRQPTFATFGGSA